jgi:hypothetical protein
MPCSYCNAPKVLARGLCQNCYHRLRNRGTLARAYQPRAPHCSVEGCERPVEAKGFCLTHYNRSQHPLRNTWKLLRSRWGDEFPPSWSDFAAFLADVGERPSKSSQLRRENVLEPWSKSNIRWTERVVVPESEQDAAGARASYSREWTLRKRYKLSSEDYNALLISQGGVCAICGRPSTNGRRLHIDHCHTTGRVRGLLCLSCNRGIGYFGDDPARIQSAAAYLSK